jgi:hypothetical protein
VKKTLGLYVAVVAAAIAINVGIRSALADPVISTKSAGVDVETDTVSAAETIACNSGVSPCAVAASATTILNVNADRHSACIQHTGTAGTAFCALGATTPSATVHNFALGFPGNTTGLPTTFCFSGGVTIWGGAVSCFGASGVSLDIVAY